MVDCGLVVGESFKNWHELKTALARMYSPKFDEEQARVSFFHVEATWITSRIHSRIHKVQFTSSRTQ